MRTWQARRKTISITHSKFLTVRDNLSHLLSASEIFFYDTRRTSVAFHIFLLSLRMFSMQSCILPACVCVASCLNQDTLQSLQKSRDNQRQHALSLLQSSPFSGAFEHFFHRSQTRFLQLELLHG